MRDLFTVVLHSIWCFVAFPFRPWCKAVPVGPRCWLFFKNKQTLTIIGRSTHVSVLCCSSYTVFSCRRRRGTFHDRNLLLAYCIRCATADYGCCNDAGHCRWRIRLQPSSRQLSALPRRCRHHRRPHRRRTRLDDLWNNRSRWSLFTAVSVSVNVLLPVRRFVLRIVYRTEIVDERCDLYPPVALT